MMNVSIQKLNEELKRKNPKIYDRFIDKNTNFLQKGEFTFIFPNELKFYDYKSIDSITIQLQILLTSLGEPFVIDINVEEYYEKITGKGEGIEISFDLTKTEFIGDLELLMIHILGFFCKKLTGKRIKVEFNKEKIKWLRQWNFFDSYYEWGIASEDIMVPYTRAKDSERVISIRKITDFDDVGRTAASIFSSKVKNLLLNEYGMNESLIKQFVSDVISEIAQNIPQHSKSMGFVMAHAHMQEKFLFDINVDFIEIVNGKIDIKKTFENNNINLTERFEIVPDNISRQIKIIDDSKKYLIKDIGSNLRVYEISDRIPNIEIAIADGGIGIRQSLYNRAPEYYKDKSHYITIMEVLDGKFIKPKYENRGGILRAREFVESFGGRISIRSICARGSNIGSKIYHDYDKPWKPWRFFPGTQVSILIPRLSVKKNHGVR